MKSIKKILLSLTILSNITYIYTLPQKIAGQNNANNPNINNQVIANNFHPILEKKAIAINSMINNNVPNQNQTTSSTSNPTSQLEVQEITLTQPLTTNQNNIIPEQSTNTNESTNPTHISTDNNESENKEQTQNQTIEEQPQDVSAGKENTAAQDEKTLVPDQATILKTLKTIDNLDNNNHALLSESAMNQLFNNFVYFKNFITENFTKEKMLHLCMEFINQIYPKETVNVNLNTMNESSKQEEPTKENNNNSQNEQEENIPQIQNEQPQYENSTHESFEDENASDEQNEEEQE